MVALNKLKVVVASVTIGASASVNCERGCSSFTSPICGADGYSYQNECVAECQGIKVASRGPCKGCKMFDNSAAASTSLRKPESGAAGAEIGAATMHKYRESGFTFLGFAPTAQDGVGPTLPTLSELPAADADDAHPELVRVSDGHLYAQAKSRQRTPSGRVEHDAYVPKQKDRRRRKLIVFGEDNRVMVNHTSQFPYNAIGVVSILTRTGEEVGWCTGALVSPTAVLTAGHCVYDMVYFSSWVFYPGRSGYQKAPFGQYSVKVQHATTFKAWTQDSNNAFDMAVLTLSEPVGKTLGHLGVTAACPQSPVLRTTGYPSDRAVKKKGVFYPYMVTEKCGGWKRDCSAAGHHHYNVEISNCDTVGGQSGSPLYTQNTHKASAVCAFAYYKKYVRQLEMTYYPEKAFNGFNVVTPKKYAVLEHLFV